MSGAPVLELGPGEAEAAERALPGLEQMLRAHRGAEPPWDASRFWEHHNAEALRALGRDGFGAFKRTVATSYFQWEPGSPFDDDARGVVARRLLALWARRPDPRVALARLAEPERSLHDESGRRWHARSIAALHSFARRRDRLGLLEGIAEPDLGRPPVVIRDGLRVSEDMANSALELNAIAEATGPQVLERASVIDLGAGYGRIGGLLLAARPATERYVVCDIPPALAIAQEYLTRTFPDLPAFRFREFGAGEAQAVAEEIAAARIAFLLPGQLDLLPPLGASLFVNVSSLHEMRRDQVDASFGLIARHAAGGNFYSKQWASSTNVWDGLEIGWDEYPVPGSWDRLLDREVVTTPGFREAVFSISGPASAARGSRSRPVARPRRSPRGRLRRT
jgi:putative sugar O-methyltransferase